METSGVLPAAAAASTLEEAICRDFPLLASLTPLTASLMLCLESAGFSTARLRRASVRLELMIAAAKVNAPIWKTSEWRNISWNAQV